MPATFRSGERQRRVRALALAISLTLSVAACADLSTGQAGTPASASPTATPTSTADCLTLGALTPSPVPQLQVTVPGDGTQRVASAEGGYSIVVPAAWLVSGNHDFNGATDHFGQTHVSSYDPRTAPQGRPEAGTILPPEVGIRLAVEVWANPFGDAPDAFAQRIRIGPDQVEVLPGSFVTLDGLQAYRFTLQDERRFQPQNAALIRTRQTRAVWIVPSPRADRVLVLYATPAESSLLPLVERAVSTLEVTAPQQAVLPVTHQRSQVLERWLEGKSGPIPGRRAEAKLMTYAEAAAMRRGQPISTPNGILRIDRDPEDLVWVVAVSGPDLPQGRGGPMGQPSRPPTAWILLTVSATASASSIGGSAAYSSAGTWPPEFDALSDRCH